MSANVDKLAGASDAASSGGIGEFFSGMDVTLTHGWQLGTWCCWRTCLFGKPEEEGGTPRPDPQGEAGCNV